jgi:hypothetical protein
VIVQFMCFSDTDKTLTGHAAYLVVARGKGGTNYMRPAISAL